MKRKNTDLLGRASSRPRITIIPQQNNIITPENNYYGFMPGPIGRYGLFVGSGVFTQDYIYVGSTEESYISSNIYTEPTISSGNYLNHTLATTTVNTQTSTTKKYKPQTIKKIYAKPVFIQPKNNKYKYNNFMATSNPYARNCSKHR